MKKVTTVSEDLKKEVKDLKQTLDKRKENMDSSFNQNLVIFRNSF